MSTAETLGTVEELPNAYRSKLHELNVFPAWTLLRAVMPVGKPSQQAKAAHWRYAELRTQLLKAGDLVPVEKAERRVLAFVNPGLHIDRLATLPSIFFGLQLILPGERAPNHHHNAAAARVVLEGDGGYTTVEGEKIPMDVGDLILTPPHFWHDHGHEGRKPMIWMDVLDHPIAVPLDISYVIPGKLAERHSNAPDASNTYYRASGLVPYRSPLDRLPDYPLRRFQWSRVREALNEVASVSGRDDAVHLRYINPENGESALKTMDFSARLVRPGEKVTVQKTSANRMLLTLEGQGEVSVNGQQFRCDMGDAVAIPTYSALTLQNPSAKANWLVIQVDDVPTQVKLGFYEEMH
jgi:gentisate 1,2-dioxygenase